MNLHAKLMPAEVWTAIWNHRDDWPNIYITAFASYSEALIATRDEIVANWNDYFEHERVPDDPEEAIDYINDASDNASIVIRRIWPNP